MTPFAAAVVTALGMLLAASLLLWNGVPVGAIAKTFPRSRRAAWVTMAISTLWTLYHITQLGEADFGRYKVPIFIGFAALAVLSVVYVPDFLAVRGTCALTLLVAGLFLSATFMDYSAPSLVLNAFVYAAIVLALYLAVSPFRLRDFFQWMFVLPHRPRQDPGDREPGRAARLFRSVRVRRCRVAQCRGLAAGPRGHRGHGA